MGAAVLTLLLFAPAAEPRVPVGPAGWESRDDPVAHRVSSLLLGTERRRGFVTVIPLYARIPSEAGHGRKDAPAWPSATTPGKRLMESGQHYLRALNDSTRPVLVSAGAVYRYRGSELFVGRDALVSAAFAALLPAHPNYQSEGNLSQAQLEYAGLLPPRMTGVLLHPKANPDAVVVAWKTHLKEAAYLEAREHPAVLSLWRGLSKECGKLPLEQSRTVVGAVFLVAGRPVATHVFGTNELFAAALPELLWGVAVQARVELGRYGPSGAAFNRLTRLAQASDERSHALASLRAALDAKTRWSESYGEGFESIAMLPSQRSVSHAVLDHRRRVVHFGLYALDDDWPRSGAGVRPGAPGGPPMPPRPPGGNGSENAPGEVDRKPRPSLSDQRQRDRRPGPTTKRPKR
ncbi:MAG: hypothetical protein ACYTGN_05735 [Planctomycetota bacterium]|jgi:hypothetical protein